MEEKSSSEQLIQVELLQIKKFSRIDICTGSKKDSLDKVVNGKLTLIKMD
jgi:hypothetical protein